MPEILTLKNLRQSCCEFEANLGFIVNARPANGSQLVSQQQISNTFWVGVCRRVLEGIRKDCCTGQRFHILPNWCTAENQCEHCRCQANSAVSSARAMVCPNQAISFSEQLSSELKFTCNRNTEGKQRLRNWTEMYLRGFSPQPK